jgi:hypothetical protein
MLQPKKKICSSCNTEQIIWKNHNGNKYCKNCWSKNSTVKSLELKSKPLKSIKSKADKKDVLDKLYSVMRKDFLSLHPGCQARLQGCTLQSTDVHHKKGRGLYYLDKTTWLSVCRSCHTWIELNPEKAKELNFSLNRLKNG